MWGQGANFSPAVPGYCADTWQVSACHCEERRDVAIRISLRQGITESSTSGEYGKVLRIRLAPRHCRADTPHVSACHCEERSDVAIRSPCGSTNQRAMPKANTEKCHEFARSTTYLPSSSAGMRIATPVCALVRNDMLKTDAFLRVQERFPAVPPGKRRHEANFCLSLRGAKRRGNP